MHLKLSRNWQLFCLGLDFKIKSKLGNVNRFSGDVNQGLSAATNEDSIALKA